jgi:VanZ family protein
MNRRKNWPDLFGLYLPWLVWLMIIFLLSSIPDLRITNLSVYDLITRKIGHFLVFGALFLLSYRILVREKSNRPYLGAISWAIIYAISDEFHQSFVPTRTASLVDLLIDSAGVIVFALLVYRNYSWQRFLARF